MKLAIMKLIVFWSASKWPLSKSFSVEKGTILKPRNRFYYLNISQPVTIK